MAGRKRRALHVGVAFIFVAFILANGISLVGAILLPSLWTYIFVLAVIALDLYFLYVRFYKKKPQYPMVPPEGKPDVYFPRSDIPRPIFDDARRMQEKKRKLAKIDKMRHKKKKKP